MRSILDAISLAPFEAMLGVVGVISGTTTFLGVAPPSIAEILPAPMVLAWAVSLLVGSPLILVGLATQQLRVEQAGLVLLAATTLIYGAAIVAVQPATATTAAATYVLYAAACLLRIRVLTRALRAREVPRSETE
ncbi:hypothetical protein ACOQFV_09115 [Nocardiopsis changdeensis]|uniref:Uncharacterized protein n=1 Tax=Nocardiopsis changdeensis TaxID=2831969 RepID=A0ABX8BG73_9ACTN|nr:MULTISPECIES: hypothetical protein [Nocardiopsis]QUX20298.1 hypothetical protein KGD84_17365 [Nocardiopsis changdeensis]QYX36228.1 hypothetical protein K1J57_26820 [Nocardiopsis sp. MT53]